MMCHIRPWFLSRLVAALLGLILMLTGSPAQALIGGGEGNAPLRDPGWPAGAANVFNVNARVAWWEGPPYGGGQWHAECRGDTAAFQRALTDFAKIDAVTKRIVVHDGVGASFWLNPNREEGKQANARIDWVFMVWVPENWQRLQGLPAGFRGGDVSPEGEPVPQIDVYTGGGINWDEVKVPEGIEVDDQRLEAHGFSLDDGIVLEGRVFDLANDQPLPARMELQLVAPKPEGGYEYTTAKTVETDSEGRWVLKHAPEGWYRVTLHADGYASRIVGYDIFDEHPRWKSFTAGLSKTAEVSGVVVDADGKPLADARVRIGDLAVASHSYEIVADNEFTTDAAGRFTTSEMPIGTATLRTYKQGYCRIGLGEPVELPASDVKLSMVPASQVKVLVDFGDAAKPNSYIVEIEPEGGSKVGSYGGSGNVDASGFIEFKNVPPGRYVLKGRPNPGGARDETEAVTVELVGGETTDVVLEAK